MDKKQSSINKFIRWVIGNTFWDYFKRFISIVSSFITTLWTSLRPRVIGWFDNMDIPLIIAIIAMFLGFFVISWGLLSFLYWLYKNMLVEKNNKTYPQYKIRKDGYEIYIDIKNKKWFIDILRIRVRCNFSYR